MNISEANAFFTLYRAAMGQASPDQAEEAAEYLSKRSRATLGAGPDATAVAGCFRDVAEEADQ